ncbi:MAG: LamG-like jellyroll fold domain-containing protein [Bacteroidota bacterium]
MRRQLLPTRFGLRPCATRLCVALLALLCVLPTARAQWVSVAPAERLSAEQPATAFFDWTGAESFAGVRTEMPVGWQLRDAWATGRDGIRIPLALATDARSRVLATAPRPLRGPLRIALRFEVGPTRGPERVPTVPLVQEGERARALETQQRVWQPYVIETSRRNLALRPAREPTPLSLRRDALPALDIGTPFTLELWMLTIGLDVVVLSTWNGIDGAPYPLELTVADDGHLLFYCGARDRHHGMRTPTPVADGQWHHVAVVHDPQGGWSRLYLNGAPADSIRATARTDNDRPLTLGQRFLDRDAEAEVAGYSGLMDEVRVWPRARTEVQLRRTLRRQLTEVPRGVLRLGFDEAPPSRLLARDVGAWPAERGDLTFSFPIEQLDAQAQDGFVNLSWETQDRENEAFVVERSLDGETFTPVARLGLNDRIAEAANGAMRFGYTDLPPAGQVLFYRVRQVFGEGPDRISGAVKIGLGTPDSELPLTLVNSPNPFPDRTLIRFEVPAAQRAELSVWDVSGHQVAVLIDREVGAGVHEIPFDARDLPSGVYFVRLSTPQTSITHKMTLAR